MLWNLNMGSNSASCTYLDSRLKLLCFYMGKQHFYSLFTFSWPRLESGSLHNGGMLILRIYFAVDGIPIEMYGESWIAGLLTSDDVMLYMAGFETAQGI